MIDDPIELGKKYCTEVTGPGTSSGLELDHVETPLAGDATRAAVYCRFIANPTNVLTPPATFMYVQACTNAKFPDLYYSITATPTCVPDDDPDKEPKMCGDGCSPQSDKPDNQKPANSVGDPIDITTRATTMVEHDYVPAHGLFFSRYYSSVRHAPRIDGMFQGWHHSYSRRLASTLRPGYFPRPKVLIWDPLNPGWMAPPDPGAAGQHFAVISRPGGYTLSFMSTDGGKRWGIDSDVNYRLASTQFDEAGRVTQWKLTAPDDTVETYDQAGRLLSIQARSGMSQTMTYIDENLLGAVTDSAGRSLQFQYDAQNRLTRMTDPAGQSYEYAYDAFNNLISVTYPDATVRQYFYAEPAFDAAAGDPAFTHLLTGTADVSNGHVARNVTITYNAQGRPTSTQLPNGANKFTLDYANMSITDPVGSNRSFSYSKVNGVWLQVGVPQPAGAGSAAVTKRIARDVNGNRLYQIDFNGNRTNYTHDMSRNLETSRVEGFFAAQPRTISTQWHPTFRLPTAIAEPRKRTTYAYDTSGNLLTRTEQASTDATGAAAFTATLTGTPRVWRYTYNSLGKVLSATGPRNDTTTYSYDAQNNLASVTNAAGHQIFVSNYDVNGRPGTITDPNGLVTTLTYSPRGWLASRNVGGETTNYVHDGIGQLTQVIQPGGGTINYTYDEAQRLIGMSDNVGNSIAYTLDPMGNRTSEQVRDPSGVLSRQTTRVYDALSRLQQITGAQQ